MAPTCPVCKITTAPADLRTSHTPSTTWWRSCCAEARARPLDRPPLLRLCRLLQFNFFCLDDKELLLLVQADPGTRDTACSR